RISVRNAADRSLSLHHTMVWLSCTLTTPRYLVPGSRRLSPATAQQPRPAVPLGLARPAWAARAAARAETATQALAVRAKASASTAQSSADNASGSKDPRCSDNPRTASSRLADMPLLRRHPGRARP